MKINSESSYHLNLMRVLAAQMVVLGHALSFLKFNTSLVHLASIGVIALFVLSGYLISCSAYHLQQKGKGFRDFFIFRFVRVFTPFIPCLTLIAITDLTIIKFGLIERYQYVGQVTTRDFFGNLLMLQNRPAIGPFGSLLIPQVNQFGSGRPLWTISFEWWLYMSLGIAYFYRIRLKEAKVLGLLMLASLVPLLNLSSFNVYSGGLIWIWILGALLFYSRKWVRWNKVDPKIMIIFMLAFAFFAVGDFMINVQWGHLNVYNLNFMLLFSIPMCLWIIFVQTYPEHVSPFKFFPKTVQLLSNYSYSLYLIHYTVIAVMIHVMKDFHPVTSLLVIIITANVIALGIAWCTEFRHRSIATWYLNRTS